MSAAESHHGGVDVTEDIFEGALAVKARVHGETLMMTDREARDLMLCLADLFPSMLPVREPASVSGYGFSRSIDNGEATALPAGVVGHQLGRGIELPMKPCGCGVLLGEVCDCGQIDAETETVFTTAKRWGRQP